jgi:hypothetical protein
LTEQEQQFWMDHLRRDGYEIEDPREIFTPLPGESASFINTDVGTDELRVRVWIWTDSNGIDHRLIDINAWPGDNESGLITIDGIAMIENGDQDLEWIDESDPEFDTYLCVFEKIRITLFEDPIYVFDDRDHYRDIFDSFFASDAGKEAIQIEDRAHKEFQQVMKDIDDEHHRLKDLYASEFRIKSILPKEIPRRYVEGLFGSRILLPPSPNMYFLDEIQAIARSIGYELEKDYRGRNYEDTHFVFVEWTPTPSEKINLLTITEGFSTKTFVLNSNNKIIRQVYTDMFLAENVDSSNSMIQALIPRTHSYFHVTHPSRQ